MPKQLFTASDIRNISSFQKSDLLFLGTDDIITPEAIDIARELGVRLVRENPSSLTPSIGQNQQSVQKTTPDVLPALKLVFGQAVIMDAFGENLATPGTNVRLKDVISTSDGSSMAAGYMALEKGEFPWTLNYDEIDIVLEGELVIKRGNVSVSGHVGDVIFIPKGSQITFGTPNNVRFVYVAFPANWNEQ